MKKRNKITHTGPFLVFIALMVLFVGAQVQAKVVLIDFGKFGVNATNSLSCNPVNAAALAATTNGPAIALDLDILAANGQSSGQSSGWTLSLANTTGTLNLTDELAGATKPPIISNAPPYIALNFDSSAWQDNLGIDQGQFINLSFEGLDPNETYHLAFVGARGESTNSILQTWEMVSGSGGNSDDIFSENSTKQSADIRYTDISPTELGRIRVKMSVAAGSTQRGAINFVELRETSVFALRHPMDPSEMRGARLEIEGYELSGGDVYFEMAPEFHGADLTDTLDMVTSMGLNVLGTRVYQDKQLGQWVSPYLDDAVMWVAQYAGFKRYLQDISNYNATHDADVGVYLYERNHLQDGGIDVFFDSVPEIGTVVNAAISGGYDDAIIGYGPVEASVDKITDLCRIGVEYAEQVNDYTGDWLKGRTFLWAGLGRGCCYYAYTTTEMTTKKGINTASGSSTFYAEIDAQVGAFSWVYKQMRHGSWQDNLGETGELNKDLPTLSETDYSLLWNDYFHQSSVKNYDEQITFLKDVVGLKYLKLMTDKSSDTLLNNVIFWGDAGDSVTQADEFSQFAAVHDTLAEFGWSGIQTTEIITPVFRAPNTFIPWIVTTTNGAVVSQEFYDYTTINKWKSYSDPDFFNVNFLHGGNAHLDSADIFGDTFLDPIVTKTGVDVGDGVTVDITVDADGKDICSYGGLGLGVGVNGIGASETLRFSFNKNVVVHGFALDVFAPGEIVEYQLGTTAPLQKTGLDTSSSGVFCVQDVPTNVLYAGQSFAISAPEGIFRVASLTITVPNPHAPVLTYQIDAAAATEGEAYSASIASEAFDPDGDTDLTFSLVPDSGPAWLTVAADGTLSGTPSATDAGFGRWTVQVTDSDGETAQTTLTIPVTPIAPMVVIDFGRLGTDYNSPGYNDVDLTALEGTTNGPNIALNDLAGNPVGWSLQLANTVFPLIYNEYADGITTEAITLNAPDSIKDNYHQTAWQDNLGFPKTFLNLSFEDLDPTKTYNLTLFGARGNKSSSLIWEMKQGSGGNSTDTFTYDSTNWVDGVVSYTDITPAQAYNGIRVKVTSTSTSARGAINLAVLRENSVAASGYDQWVAGWGVDIGATTNDYDDDGLDNLVEYGLDGNPTNVLVQGTLPVFFKSSNGLVYVHPQRSDDTNLVYTVETATNLVSGSWTNAGTTAGGTDVTGGTLDFVTNEVDTVEVQKFIRLKIDN